jgi:hypothetical protein
MMTRAWCAIVAPLFLISCGHSGSESSPVSTVEVKVQPNGASAALPPAKGTPRLSVDKIGEVVDPLGKPPVVIPAGGDIVMSGFAIDEPAHVLASGVDIVIDELPFTAHYHLDRPDVATYFKMPDYAKSGFQFTMPAKFFGKGKHTVSARVVAGDGKTYRESPPFTIDIQ